jgi:hypothetical protein
MTAAPSLPVPGARAVLGWLRDPALLRPRRLWYAPLLFHHIEALVSASHVVALEPLRRGLLRALSADPAAAAALGLERPLLSRLLGELEADGLLRRNDGGWLPTDAGRRAAAAGSFETQTPQRRSFHFVDNACCGRPNAFIHLNRPLSGPPTAIEGWRFDAAALYTCMERSAEWKAAHQFPTDVQRIYHLNSELPGEPPSWRRVPIDQAEQALTVLVETATEGGGATLHGFTVRAEGWTVFREAPLFTLPEWSETLPDATEPPPEAWRRAWTAWSAAHGVTEEDAAACRVERTAEAVHVRGPKRVLDRLKGAKGDPLRHELCLLSEGRCRLAAGLEVEVGGDVA